MMYTMPKNLLSICVNFTLATQRNFAAAEWRIENGGWRMNVIGNRCAAQTNFHKLHRKSEHYSPTPI